MVTTKTTQPPNDWPRMGAISFQNVRMKYQHHLPLVLNDVSFNIECQEKIGTFYNCCMLFGFSDV